MAVTPLSLLSHIQLGQVRGPCFCLFGTVRACVCVRNKRNESPLRRVRVRACGLQGATHTPAHPCYVPPLNPLPPRLLPPWLAGLQDPRAENVVNAVSQIVTRAAAEAGLSTGGIPAKL